MNNTLRSLPFEVPNLKLDELHSARKLNTPNILALLLKASKHFDEYAKL
jgi:hypothetical protein